MILKLNNFYYELQSLQDINKIIFPQIMIFYAFLFLISFSNKI